MSIQLKPEHEQRITEFVRSGAYQSADEVIDEALTQFLDREEWFAAHRTEIAEQIQQGYASAQRGELMDADEVRRSLEERKSAWLKAHGRS